MCCETHRKITRIMAERSELYHKTTSDTKHATHTLQAQIDNKEIELLCAFAELKSNAPAVPETLTCVDGTVYYLQEHSQVQYRYVTAALYDPDNVIYTPVHRIEQILNEMFISIRTDLLIKLEGDEVYIAVE